MKLFLMTFQEYRVKIITEMWLGSLQGKKLFYIKGRPLKSTGAPSSKKWGAKSLIFIPFKQKGNIKCLCDAERVPGSVPALGTSKGERCPSEGTEQWNSPPFAGVQLQASSWAPAWRGHGSLLLPSLPHTTVLLHLCIKSKMGEKSEPVFYSLQFSIFKTERAAEGFKSVTATEEPCSAWVMLSTLINQSSHSYEEMFFKNLILNLIWVWN